MIGRILAIAAVLVALGGSAAAFHERGVANCDGCHLSHPAEGGSDTVVPSGEGGLLKAESPTDVCLLCHAETLGSVLGGDPLVPPPERGAGNFVFLLEDNLNDAPAAPRRAIPGDAAGHNLVAPGHALSADPRYSRAPGGSFPSSEMGCTSCHDPHGAAGFRMLHGAGPVMGGVATFSNPAPEADAIDIGSGQESATNHTAYRRGMSDWCANCHGQYHESRSTGGFGHPTDAPLGVAISQRYNEYRGDADPTGGVAATAYLPEVAFEDEGNTTGSTEGPGPASRVMCLSCHRAHATSSPAAGRWDFRVSVLGEDGVESGSYRIPNPYGDPDQGPLCGQCHGASPDLGNPLEEVEPGLFKEPTEW